jgi:ankyrin repeat protein
MNHMKKNIKTLTLMSFLFAGLTLVGQDEQKSNSIRIIDGRETTLMHEAARENNVKEVERLLDAGFPVDLHDGILEFTPLHTAACFGAVDVIQLLLSRGADINATSGGYGWTPLVHAVRWGQFDAVVALVQAGANFNIRNVKIEVEGDSWEGSTPLLYAVRYWNTNVALFLINAGADVNVVDVYNISPLHYTIYMAAYRAASDIDDSRYLKVFRSLIEHGANINHQDIHGHTTLHKAVQLWKEEMVKCLLSLGVRTDILDENGHNAEFYANTETMKALFHTA